MCNIIVIYLPTSPTLCCYTTLGNIGCSSKGLTGQSYTWMQKNWFPIFAGCTSLIFINPGTKIDGCYYRNCTDAADAAIHSFHCWWPLRILARQCTSASCASDGWAPSAWNSQIYCFRLNASNSPDLNAVDYRIRGVMQDRVYQTPVRDVTDLKQRLTDT